MTNRPGGLVSHKVPVLIVLIDRLPPVTTGGEVVQSAGAFDA
jgi:hypothetical protein